MVDVLFVNESGRELTQRHGWWWCAAAAILFGAATPATKMLVDDAGALTIAGLQVIFALAPFIGGLLARPINGDQVTPNMVVAFAVSLVGVLVVATSHHRHRHAHQLVEHSHPIDPTDPHHQPGTIEVVSGAAHRHLPLTHEHEHLPDIHHRHEH